MTFHETPEEATGIPDLAAAPSAEYDLQGAVIARLIKQYHAGRKILHKILAAAGSDVLLQMEPEDRLRLIEYVVEDIKLDKDVHRLFDELGGTEEAAAAAAARIQAETGVDLGAPPSE